MFNRFDILSAYYVYGSDYHTGQFSKEYAYMGRVLNCGFRPADSLRYETLSDNGKEIYDNLVANRPKRQMGVALGNPPPAVSLSW